MKRIILKILYEFYYKRTVILCGSSKNKILEIEIGLLLNEYENLILRIKVPTLFKQHKDRYYSNYQAKKSDITNLLLLTNTLHNQLSPIREYNEIY